MPFLTTPPPVKLLPKWVVALIIALLTWYCAKADDLTRTYFFSWGYIEDSPKLRQGVVITRQKPIITQKDGQYFIQLSE
jgi:hypothetical protein